MMNLMMRLMNRVLPSCEEVSLLSSRAMDEELPLRERIALRLHLMMCIWCRRSVAQLNLMRNLARRSAAASGGPTPLDSAARERMENALAAAENNPPDA